MKKLGFGTMRLPLLDSSDVTSIDYEQMCMMADLFLEQGFTYFDTAYPYHGEHSEEAVRRCLVERYPRGSYVLADKMPILRVKSADDYKRYFDEQISRCGVADFDYYLLHNMGKERYINTVKYGGFEFIQKMKEQGCVKKTGFSYHDDAQLLDRILTEHPEVDFVQLQINYLDWDSIVIQSGACYEVACKHHKPVAVMEPVKGGLLARLPEKAMQAFKEGAGEEASPAAFAIRYAASLDNVFMVLSGMSAYEQLKENTAAMRDFKPLDEKEQALLKNVAAIVNSSTAIECTACGYCMEECPKNINIPAYFGLYNLYGITGKKTQMYYERHSMEHGKAMDCLHCGKCERVCPQHLDIRGYLEKYADLYEKSGN